MFCKHCGKQLPDGSRFCDGCGQDQGVTTAGEVRPGTPPYPPQNAYAPYVPQNAPPPPWMAQAPAVVPQKSGKGTKIALFCVLGVLLLAALVYFAIRLLSPGLDASAVAGNWYGAFSLTGYTGDAAQEDAAKAARGRQLTASVMLTLDQDGAGAAIIRFDAGGEAALSAEYSDGALRLKGDLLGGAADILLTPDGKEGARTLTGSGTAVSVSGSTRFDAVFAQTGSSDTKPASAVSEAPAATSAPTLAPAPTPTLATPVVPVLSSELLIGEWVSDEYGDGTYDYMFVSSEIYLEYGYGIPGEGDSIDTWNTGSWSKDLYGDGTYSIEGDTLTISWYDGTEPSKLIVLIQDRDLLRIANASSPEEYTNFYRIG